MSVPKFIYAYPNLDFVIIQIWNVYTQISNFHIQICISKCHYTCTCASIYQNDFCNIDTVDPSYINITYIFSPTNCNSNNTIRTIVFQQKRQVFDSIKDIWETILTW